LAANGRWTTGSFRYRSQRYYFGGVELVEARDGRLVEARALLSQCPDCGEWFRQLATKSRIQRRNLVRRCDDCKRPGSPVEPRRARKKPEESAAAAAPRKHRRKKPGPRRAPRRRVRVVAPTAKRVPDRATAAVPVVRPPVGSPRGPRSPGAPSALVAAVERAAASARAYREALGMLNAIASQELRCREPANHGSEQAAVEGPTTPAFYAN